MRSSINNAKPSSVSCFPERSNSAWGSRAAAFDALPGGIRLRYSAALASIRNNMPCPHSPDSDASYQVLRNGLSGFDSGYFSLMIKSTVSLGL